MVALAEGLVFDGLDLNGTGWKLQGLEIGPPPKLTEWAQSGTADGGVLLRNSLHEVREVTVELRVSQQSSINAALGMIGALTNKLEDCENQPEGLPLVWTPANSTKSLTLYVLSGSIDGIPISMDGDEAGWFLRSPVVTVKLMCDPFLHGTETGSSVASATTAPFVTLLLTDVPGDVPAKARLVVTDTGATSRRYLEWGVEQRNYNAATSLLVDSDDMVTTGYAGSQTTRSGAYDPNASGNSVVRATLGGSAMIVCATADLSHVGTFRVKARVYGVSTSGLPSNIKLRLSWQEGDGLYAANSWVSPTMLSAFSEVDLGVVTVPPAALGTQRWRGRIEAYTASGLTTDTLDVDYLILVPAGEGYGKARAPMIVPSLPLPTASDAFNQGGSPNLLNQTADSGGIWTTTGATGDLAINSTDHRVQRNITGDTTARWAYVGGSIGATDVSCDVMVSTSSASGILQGVFARLSDADHWMAVWLRDTNGNPWTLEVVQRNGAVHDTFAVVAVPVPTVWTRLRLLVDSAGRFTALLNGRVMFSGASSTLNASGYAGFMDSYSSAVACFRYYDNFLLSALPEDVVLNASRSAEIRHDGEHKRQDSTGTYYGPVPAYRGGNFLVPPAGDKNLTSRLLVKAASNDVDTAASAETSSNLSVQAFITPRYLAVPN